MDITDDMLAAAMKKAVEAGLLPRHATVEEVQINRELIREVVQASLEAMRDNCASASPRYRPTILSDTVHQRFNPPVESNSSDFALFR